MTAENLYDGEAIVAWQGQDLFYLSFPGVIVKFTDFEWNKVKQDIIGLANVLEEKECQNG